MQEGNIIGFCRQAKLFERNLFSKKYLFFQMVKPGGLDYLHSPSVRLLRVLPDFEGEKDCQQFTGQFSLCYVIGCTLLSYNFLLPYFGVW